ncbi:MAG: hypothetical protein JHC98_00390 [Thermoleophilaceae bacterium]|nr:hypothetical protein [Thermoleophilaceae bacterium]
MGIYFRHLAAAAAIVCLTLFAAGCGDGDSESGQLPDPGATGKSNNEVVVATGAVSAEVKAKQEALAKKAKKIKAAAKKAGTTTPPEGMAGQKCRSKSGYSDVTTLGFDCSAADKLLVVGDDRWVVLPAKKTKVGKYACTRIRETKSYLKFQCTNLGRSIQFKVPTG